MIEVISQYVTNNATEAIAIAIVLFLSCVEVSKIQINPWSTILSWIGKQCNKDLYEQNVTINTTLERYDDILIELRNENATLQQMLSECRQDITELSHEYANLNREITSYNNDFKLKLAEGYRWSILRFANSCRHGQKHSREEWTHVLDAISKYEAHCEMYHIENAVMQEDSRYIKDAYSFASASNDFLV